MTFTDPSFVRRASCLALLVSIVGGVALEPSRAHAQQAHSASDVEGAREAFREGKLPNSMTDIKYSNIRMMKSINLK